MNKKKYTIYAVVVTLVVAFDQWTKHLIHTRFRWGESLTVIPGFFDLTYVRNMGAAFGLFHQAPAGFREPFFFVVPVLVLIGITVAFFRLAPNQKWTIFALSLVTGGAIGNLIDRFRFGFVVDFLDAHWKEAYHWPAFNVADSAIVVGVAILFLQSFQKNSPNA